MADITTIDTYASFEQCDAISRTIWESASIDTMTQVVQYIAAAFILFNWYQMYLQRATKQLPLDLYAILEGIFYVVLVGASGTILTYADSLMVDFGHAVTSIVDIPEGMTDAYMNEYDNWTDYLNPLSLLYEGIRFLVLALLQVMDFAYFLTRGFLIFFLKLAFPLVLALGAIKENRSMFWRFVKTYLAVYLIGYGYLISIAFTNAAFIFLVQSSNVSADFSIVPLMIVLAAKKLMFSEVNSIAKQILS